MKVEEWARENKISLNPSKCCLFTRYGAEKEGKMGLRIGGREIEQRKEFKFLG